MADGVGILVCETVADEFATVVSREGWQDARVIGLPGGCVPGAPAAGRPPPDARPLPTDLDLHHLRCSCRQNLPATVTVHDHVAGRRLATVFQLFLPADLVDQHLADGAHLVTPGWLVRWPERLASQGFTVATAREMFQEFARRIVLVDTGIAGDARTRCGEFAAYLDLPWLAIDAGLDLATLILRDIMLEIRHERQVRESEALQLLLKQQRASCSLVLDLQRDLSAPGDEATVLDRIGILCTSLYAPATLVVASLRDGGIHHRQPPHAEPDDLAMLHRFLTDDASESHAPTPDERGFMLRFSRSGTTNGGVLMSDFAFPENRDAYLNQALSIAPVCELVIARARALQGIVPVCSYCHRIRDRRGDWRRFEEYLLHHSDALFSHSVCPGCLRQHFPDESNRLGGEAGPGDRQP